jgi:predicted KAP-like P-loop ATPase
MGGEHMDPKAIKKVEDSIKANFAADPLIRAQARKLIENIEAIKFYRPLTDQERAIISALERKLAQANSGGKLHRHTKRDPNRRRR